MNITLDLNIMQLLFSLMISIITAIITAKIALKHFFKQEIWLRKEKEYTKIIDELCTLLSYQGTLRDEFLSDHGIDIDNSKDDKLIEEEYKKARINIEKVRFSTGFMIDSKVNEVIDSMIKDLVLKGEDEHQWDYFGYINRVYELIKVTIEEIIIIASEDLKINN